MSLVIRVAGGGGAGKWRSSCRYELPLHITLLTVLVGCVFVQHSVNNPEGIVVSTGFNETNESRNGTRHAEMVAIDKLILHNDKTADIFQQCDL
jgi:tRNA(Arg) A34 adenosine deaminase TadA